MSLKETVVAHTKYRTLENTSEFIPVIKWCRVLGIINGNSIWVCTYFVGSCCRFRIILKNITIPKLSEKVAIKELHSYLMDKIIQLDEVSWGDRGSLIAVVTVGFINMNRHMTQQGLTSNLGIKKISVFMSEEWEILTKESDKIAGI